MYVEIIQITERGGESVISKAKTIFQYLNPYYWLHIYSYDNAASITQEMKIINYTYMIETDKYSFLFEHLLKRGCKLCFTKSFL